MTGQSQWRIPGSSGLSLLPGRIGEAGVRLRTPGNKAEVTTPRPDPRPRRQGMQRPCDRNELSQSTEQSEVSAAGAQKADSRWSEEGMGQGQDWGS